MPDTKPRPIKKEGNKVRITDALIQAATGSADKDHGLNILNQVTNTLWIPSGLSEEEQMQRIASVLEAMKAIAPRDGAEGLLAAQMVATHTAAMECLRRAALGEQTFEGRDLSLKHASKLMALYARQMEALDKHRGKGQQKITVEHVNVHAGGQAIVGNVESPAGSAGQAAPPATAVSHQPAEMAPSMPPAQVTEGAPRPRKEAAR